MKSHLKLALVYYYWAVQASQRRFEEAIINLMISAEALLIVSNESIRGSLSRRLSTLITSDEEEKKTIEKKMRELYELRSAIVHGGRKKPTFKDVRTLFSYVRRAIDNVLSSKEFLKESLVERLDEKYDSAN